MSSIEELKQIVEAAIKSAPASKQIRSVNIEPEVDDEGTEFLRVILGVRDEGQQDEEALEALLEKIEGALLEIDSRYPSVRFQDAA